MKEILYIEGVISVPDIADLDGDVLSKADIRKMYANMKNLYVDQNHDGNPLEDTFVNAYILEQAKTIAGEHVPAGSLVAEIKTNNPEVIRKIRANNWKGLSLMTTVKTNCPICSENLSLNQESPVDYDDIPNKECLAPQFVSFVRYPANNYKMDVYTYENFIKKEENNMEFNIDELKKALRIVKNTEVEIEPIEKEQGESDSDVEEGVAPEENTETIQFSGEAIIDYSMIAEIVKEAIIYYEENKTDDEDVVEKTTTTEEKPSTVVKQSEIINKAPAKQEIKKEAKLDAVFGLPIEII